MFATNITVINSTADTAFMKIVSQKVQNFSKFNEKISGIYVFLKEDNKVHKTTDKIVQIKITSPKKELIVEKRSKHFPTSLKMAVNSMENIIKKAKRNT